MNLIQAFTNEQLKTEVPVIRIGDTVRIHNKIVEGTKERIQLFEGTVIAKHGGGISETFTVRRVSYGVGVEKTFFRFVNQAIFAFLYQMTKIALSYYAKNGCPERQPLLLFFTFGIL